MLLLTALIAPLTAAIAHPTHPGKWTEPVEWGGVAIHMALLPGFSPYHSRIVWWAGGEHVAGGVKGWTAPVDATVNGGSFPSSNFTPHALDHAPADPFCAGHAPLSDGKLLVAGGNTLVEVGIRNAMLFDHDPDVNGTWTPVDTMRRRRWYPTVTLLGDGRAVTVSGNEFFHYVTVGGVTESPDTSTRMLERLGVAPAPTWDASLVPLRTPVQSPPYEPLVPFSEATISSPAGPRHYLFGGRDVDGELSDKMRWIERDRNVDGQEYKFFWAQVNPIGAFPAPSRRTGHVALAVGENEIIYIGGLDPSGPQSQVYQATISNAQVTWRPLTLLGGIQLPPLHGHVAIYDGGDGRTNRIFLWGGTTTTNGPADNAVMYSIQLNLAGSTVTVDTVTQSGTPPEARQYASLTLDAISRYGMPTELPPEQDPPPPTWPTRYRAMLFGGKKADGSYTNELYAMWIKNATEVVWEPLSVANPPAGRIRHGAAADNHTQWLVISGGETAEGQATNTVFAYDLACGQFKRCDKTTPHWEHILSPLPRPMRGHSTLLLTPEPAFPRHPEVYDPLAAIGSRWRILTDAPQWQEWYPFGFTMPRRSGDVGDPARVFYAGPVDRSMVLTVRDGTLSSWAPLPAVVDPSPAVTFKGGSAVMYRPGKVMKSGTRDTETDTPHGKTAVIDLKAPTPAWTASANEMIGRNNHNLVVLPDGQVLVVAGANVVGNGTSNPEVSVTMPQIWNPDTLTAGYWYGNVPSAFGFDSSTVDRNYHTSAVLLPDGRVLVAGGSNDVGGGQTKADLYSPYYLFNASGQPAARPTIQNAPSRVAYGERFSLRMGPNDNQLSKVSLIRPGATTHGFDQNQRFVPLTFQVVNPHDANERRFLVQAPGDSLDAPPGDYLLFALNAAGTPAIARWINLRTTNLDPVHPSMVLNLSKDCSHGTSVDLKWSPPCVDSVGASTPCPGPAASYQLRYRIGSMNIWDDWAGGTLAPNMPQPVDPVAASGQTISQAVTVSGLTLNSTYHFRLISKDYQSGSGHWSAMSNDLVVTTIDEECGGSGGGGGGCCEEGASARRAGGHGLRRPGGGTNSTGFLENTLFANLQPDVAATDVMRLPYGPKWSNSAAHIRLSRSGDLGTRFSRVRLLSLSVPEGQEAFTANGQVVVGSLVPATAIRHADQREFDSDLAKDMGFDGHPGDTLLVEFANATPGRISLVTSGAQLVAPPARTGIDVQCETAQGWTTVAHHDPRQLTSDALHDVPSAGRLRLVFHGDHRLHGVARFVPGDAGTLTAYEPTSLAHSVAGDVRSSLASTGALIAPGESMVATFAATPSSDAPLEWFMEVGGKHTAVSTSGTYSQRPGAGGDRPLRFALEQNQPNPFGNDTRIGFELPQRAAVRLEVFDLLGRRVAMLANTTYEPGRYSVTWDRRGRSGARMPAGVYTCRYTAGEHQEQKRMIVFP